MRNMIRTALLVGTLATPMMVMADAPKADDKAAAKTEEKADAKKDDKAAAKKDATKKDAAKKDEAKKDVKAPEPTK